MKFLLISLVGFSLTSPTKGARSIDKGRTVAYTTVVYTFRKNRIEAGMTPIFRLIVSLLLLGPLYAQSSVPPPRTTDVLVILTVRPGVARDQLMKVMPDEIRATVRLYLDGKIRQWYSRADGKGVVFILDCKDVVEARSVMDSCPFPGSSW